MQIDFHALTKTIFTNNLYVKWQIVLLDFTWKQRFLRA